jgi:tight adherence protein C
VSPLLVSFFIFALLTGAATAIYLAASSQRHMTHARMAEVGLKARTSAAIMQGLSPSDRRVTRLVLKWAVDRIPKPKAASPRGVKMAALLMRAGFTSASAPAVFQLVKSAATAVGLLAGVVAAIVLAKSGSRLVMLAVLGGALGAWLPGYYLGKRAKNRRAEIARQLSDVLDLLVVCVEAGLGLLEAIKVVGRETEAQNLVIGHELSMVSGEVNAGASLGQALRALAARTAVDDIKPLAATLIQSEQLGAAIGPALRSISDAIRIRRRMRAEEAAQRTTIKILFPLVLMILPAMLLIIVGPAIVETIRTLSS